MSPFDTLISVSNMSEIFQKNYTPGSPCLANVHPHPCSILYGYSDLLGLTNQN